MTARDVNAFVLVVFLALGLVFQTALPAQGCSCMMPDPYGGLAEADGAFVGTLLEVDRGVAPITNSGQLIDFRFEVEAALKGEIGDEIVVKSAADGASCGLELPVGERAGFLLTLDNGEWNGNLCWTIDPDALLAAAEGPPEPVQGSPPHLIVFSQMGDAGVIALDRQGEIVGYGEGPQPSLVSACPDDETFIGLTPDNSIRVWSFTDLAVVGEYHLDPDIAPWFNHLICTGPGGNPILGTSTLSGIDRTTLIRHADGVTEALREDVEWLIATSRGPVAIGSDGSILSVDANSGDLKELAEPLGDVHGQLTAVVPSPDGSHLAIGAVDWSLTPQQGRAFVIDVDNGTSVGIDVECDVYPVWLDNEQISILDSCTSEVPVVYTTDLELVGSGELSPFGYWGWSVTDETGAVFYPGEFGLNVLEPGATTGTQFGHSMGFPSAALLVPETARETWTGSDFVPAAVTDVPIVDEPLPPIDVPPVDQPVSSFDAPAWLVTSGAVLIAGVLLLMLRRPSRRDEIGIEESEPPAAVV